MPRFFVCFVTGHLIVLLGVGTLGLFHRSGEPSRHVALAVFSLLLTCLLQAAVFVYLNVTGKMIGQAAHLGGLDLKPVVQARRLKSVFTRAMGAVVLTMVLITATGAYQWREGTSLYFHLPAACLFLTVHLAAFYFEYGLICKNQALVAEVLRRYASRGRATPVRPEGGMPEARSQVSGRG